MTSMQPQVSNARIIDVKMILLIGGHQVLGDFLCILAALAQCISLVCEEFLIKEEIGIIDYMAMLGFSGALASSIQM